MEDMSIAKAKIAAISWSICLEIFYSFSLLRLLIGSNLFKWLEILYFFYYRPLMQYINSIRSLDFPGQEKVVFLLGRCRQLLSTVKCIFLRSWKSTQNQIRIKAPNEKGVLISIIPFALFINDLMQLTQERHNTAPRLKQKKF